MIKLYKNLKQYKWLLALIFILLCIQVGTNLWLPTLMSNIVDVGILNSDTKYILEVGIQMVVVTIIGMITMILATMCISRVGMGFARDIRRKLFIKVESFSQEESLKKFDKINEKLYISGWKSQFISGILMPIMRAISNFTYVVVAVLGGIFVSNGYITIGELQAFIKYVSQLTEPISQVANIMNVLQSTVVSAQRVFEILDEEEE